MTENVTASVMLRVRWPLISAPWNQLESAVNAGRGIISHSVICACCNSSGGSAATRSNQ